MLSETLGQFPLDSFIIRDSKDTHESCCLCPKHWTGELPTYRPQSHSHVSVQFSCSVISDSATPWTAACQASLSHVSLWLQKRFHPQAKAIIREHGYKAEVIKSIDQAKLKGNSFDTFVFSLHFYTYRPF